MTRRCNNTVNLIAILAGLMEMVNYCTYYDLSKRNSKTFFSLNIGGSHQLPIETVLSKSFSLSSYSEQSQIIPYYYMAEQNLTGEDITIVTLVTRNRIPNLARLATQYQGNTPTT